MAAGVHVGCEEPEAALGASEGETLVLCGLPFLLLLDWWSLSSVSGAGLAVPHSLACPVPDWRFFTVLHSSAWLTVARACIMRVCPG